MLTTISGTRKLWYLVPSEIFATSTSSPNALLHFLSLTRQVSHELEQPQVLNGIFRWCHGGADCGLLTPARGNAWAGYLDEIAFRLARVQGGDVTAQNIHVSGAALGI